jgi:sigma-54 dependent transcriptional regulator, acetoin dehydrogenase operon transcriptional activator AcoR
VSKFYENQILELFGEFVSTSTYNFFDGSIKSLKKSDLIITSTDAFDRNEEYIKYIPKDQEVVEVEITYTKKAIEMLNALPGGTEALFVNLSENMTMEAITRLSQLGINNIKFTPYYPGCTTPINKFNLAVTSDEERYVPKGIEKIINIGQRVLDSKTIVEIALKLGLNYVLEGKEFREYFNSIMSNNYVFDKLFGRSLRLESQFEILTNIMDDGIVGVDENGFIFSCNSKAYEIAGITGGDVLNKSAELEFPFIPFEECKKTGRKIANRLVKVNNVDINYSISPVIRGNEYIGSFATFQRFLVEENKQHNLRLQMLNRGHESKYTFKDIAGESSDIKKTKLIAEKMARTSSTILITGESGTGKELFAHAIHNSSPRSKFPFIALNCGAMPDNLLESELFGYEEGAFTGARKGGKIGLFEFAHKGTLFLDEVEGMSPSLQVKLLRVIQEGEVMRVGGNKIITIDVRIVAATNESLEALIASGDFRKDLYYRLNTLPLQIPPLRERKNDIMFLFNLFKKKLGGRFNILEDAQNALINHNWDGNIRELQNYVEYLVYLDKEVIELEDLPQSFHFFAKKHKVAGKNTNDINKDADLLSRIAGSKIEDYIFVLNCLKDAYLKLESKGRESIIEDAKNKNIYLTQQEVRSILSSLDGLSLVKVSKGRGGSKITNKGLLVIDELNKI